MKLIKKLISKLKPPSPKELGRSKNNFLEMREFSPHTTNYTWEDWHEEVKRDYPVRYFIFETLKLKLGIKKRQLSQFIWDIKYRIMPEHKYHYLKLSQPKGFYEKYQHGWIECDQQMLFALFGILRDYVEKQLDGEFPTFSESETQDISYYEQIKFYEEAKDLYDYWINRRKIKKENLEKLLNEWSELRKSSQKTDNELYKKYRKAEKDFENEEDKNLIRLVKIRRYMWV